MGFLPGLTTPGGVTHQSIDDIALMAQLPNMTVLEVGDAVEARTVLDVMANIDGPVYCRVLRGEVPALFDTPMKFNSARELTRGDELLILSCGVRTEPATQLVQALQGAGVEVGHLHISTLKPFTDELVLARLSTARAVVTIENHLVRGGLGTSVAELIAENELPAKLTRVGVRDSFTHGGTSDYLFDYYNLGPRAIMDAIEAALGRTLFERADTTPAERLQHHAAEVAEGL
jgi:transketolase